MKRSSALLLAAILTALPGCASSGRLEPMEAQDPSKIEKVFVYFGTYTRGASKGIYQYSMDPATGKLTAAGVTEGIANPSFLAIHPKGTFLYSVGEVGNYKGKRAGAVSAFAVDPKSGALTHLNTQSSEGGGPCHLVVDKAGRNVLVANYGGGSVACLPIDADGRLRKASSFIQHKGSSVNPRRQKGPHAHSINVDAGNNFAFAADLGLDKVLIYKLDSEKGTLTPNTPAFGKVAPGGGPRHFAFHPGGKFAYTNNEITSSVTAFSYDAKAGVLKDIGTASTLPKGFSGGNSTAEVQVSPNGKFVYCSNRGHDSIAIFRVDQATGRLTAIGHESTQGKTPRNFGIDPTGSFLIAANQNSSNVVVFRMDKDKGTLTPTGQNLKVPTPVCVKFLAVRR